MGRRFLLSAVLIAAPAAPAEAQRSLSWDELSVQAGLDADGRLRVKETQVMVMSGDWNGGERRFAVRPGQGLELHRLARLDPATGAAFPLSRGSLALVDRYDWADANTLRWRSRRPSDPPFRSTRLIYELEYTYSDILRPRGGEVYLLDHDFAFADRPGLIRRFRLDLELHPVWTPRGRVPAGIEVRDLPPGRGYVSTLELVFRGEAAPAGVDRWGPRVATAAWVALFTLPPLVLVNAWWRERRLGRFDPLPAVSRAWLQHSLLAAPPEVVGAAWDELVGAPEVAAVIARLQAEGKLETRLGPPARLGRPEMTLTLKAPLREFRGYEHDLLRGLFLGGATEETSTKAIRQHYQSKGFDPAELIQPEVEEAAEVLVGRDRAPRPSWLPATLLFWGGAALLFLGGRPPADASPLWIPALFVLVFSWAIGHAAAAAWRRRVDRGLLAALPVVILAVIPLAVVYAFLRWGGAPGWRSLTHAGAAAIGLSFFVGIVNAARSRRGPISIRRRKQLCAARRFFQDELRRPRPALDDAWFPYAVAFGLEKDVERWFGRFGSAASASSTSSRESLSSGGSPSPSSRGTGTWTGGGGSFGGAGATGSWAAALGGLAAGVAAPSSSGGSDGGGGGGSGGSSGGGGGGGW
jgi:uncharacterized membrane protein YgcG